MDIFEFIVGMISVILALAIAQLFIGVSDLIQRRDRVRFFLPHSVWATVIFLIAFLHWWSLWTFKDLDWNFAMFFYSLLGPSLMFFATTILNPRDRGKDTLDLAEYFMDTRHYFLGVTLVVFLLFTFDGPLFGTEQLFNSLRVAQAVVTACIVWGIVSDNRRSHTIIALAVLGSLLAVVSIRFLPGQG